MTFPPIPWATPAPDPTAAAQAAMFDCLLSHGAQADLHCAMLAGHVQGVAEAAQRLAVDQALIVGLLVACLVLLGLSARLWWTSMQFRRSPW